MLLMDGVSGHGSVEFLENIYHRGGGPRGFFATVQLCSDAACVCLLFVLDQQNFMNHRTQRFDGQPLECIGHRTGDEIGVFCRAADDQAECDDAGWRISLEDGGDSYRDFKSAGHTDQIDAALWNELAKLLDRILDQCVGKLLIVFRGDDADPDFWPNDAGFWRQS